MQYDDEKDYVLRIIKEATSVLFTMLTGKKYRQLYLASETRYEVSGNQPNDFRNMADLGQVNEAENILLDGIDYSNKDEVIAAALFYQYVSEKGEDFLQSCNYSEEEALDGFRQLMERSGYWELFEMVKRNG